MSSGETSGLHLFLLEDGGEKFWISARDEYDASCVFSEQVDGIGESEKVELMSKMTLFPDDQIVTLTDGTKISQAASLWAATGRDVVGSTCH